MTKLLTLTRSTRPWVVSFFLVFFSLVTQAPPLFDRTLNCGKIFTQKTKLVLSSFNYCSFLSWLCFTCISPSHHLQFWRRGFLKSVLIHFSYHAKTV